MIFLLNNLNSIFSLLAMSIYGHYNLNLCLLASNYRVIIRLDWLISAFSNAYT